MKSYEGMFVLRPDLNKENLDKVLGQIEEVIAKHKGSTAQIKDWGMQKLAYPIKKYKNGIYYLITFHIAPEAIAKIKRSFSLNESILRTLILRA